MRTPAERRRNDGSFTAYKRSPLWSALARCGLAALAAGGLLLRGRATLARARARRPRVRLLSATARRAGGVRDPRRALLRHALFLELLVLLLVFDACALVRHLRSPSFRVVRGVPAASRPKTGVRQLRRVLTLKHR